MGAKVTRVRLQAGERIESFELGHAERLLKLQGTRWSVAGDENVEWTGNGFRPKKDRKRSQESEQEEGDS